jgi:mTERF domain-containing protein
VSYPQILGLSIQQNLKPTLRWFSSLGLERGHIAKIISYHPRIVGFSIQKKLGPTVQWFLDIGLSKSQMSKCVASFPQLIGLSAQGNLRGKVELLQRHFPSHVVVEMIATNPRILSYRHHRLEMRLDALVRLDLKEKVISTMSMPNDVFCERFLTRIGGNVQLALSTITTQPMSGQGSHQDLS